MLRFIFGQKNKEESPGDILDRDDEAPKKRAKKKKEEYKPWSKRERYIVLSVLATTILASGVLAMAAREWKLPGFPRIKLPVLKSETIVIEKKPDLAEKSIEDTEKMANEAISRFNEITLNLSGVYGLYVIDLNSGFSYGVNQDEEFQAASLIKLPVMAGLYMKYEEGELDIDEIYTLKAEDKKGGSGSLIGVENGTEFTYRELVQYMGKESDNTAFTASVNYLGEDSLNSIINDIGMWDTSYDTNKTTPRDVGIFFQKLWEGRLVDNESESEILDTLTDTVYESWLPAGIPSQIEVAHKYGREIHVVNDAGIVMLKEHPYIVVILSKGVIETEADESLPMISEAVYKVHSN